jgi:hypothetical protein
VVTADIAIACCRRATDAQPQDLYPDPDAPLLIEALRSLGSTARAVSWDDPLIEWSSFDRVLVSSTWDSVDRPLEYLQWAQRVSTVTALINPAPVLEWGLDKRHQRELEDAGVPVIETTWVGPGSSWEMEAAGGVGELVVKPSISAGGRETARYGVSDAPAVDAHVRRLLDAGQTVMIQQYLPAIDAEGEVDIVFIAGEMSHAVRKEPVLQLGESPVERPWERISWSGVCAPNRVQRAVALDTMATVSDLLGQKPVYGRVDLVTDAGGHPRVLEVELVDPSLSLDLCPDAALELAHAILRTRPDGC